MRYLLDTNAPSEAAKARPDPSFADWAGLSGHGMSR